MINRIRIPRWLNDLNYGLLYPAFFGNMVYDIINMVGDLKSKKNVIDGNLLKLDIGIGCIIILFYIFDFIHLYACMNKIVPENRRSNRYLICDIVTPFLFFIGFVATKHNHYLIATVLIGTFPFVIFFYKIKNITNANSLNLFKFFAIPYLLTGIVAVIIFTRCIKIDFYNIIIEGIFMLIYSLLGAIIYLKYVFISYRTKGFRSDVRYMYKTKNVF